MRVKCYAAQIPQNILRKPLYSHPPPYLVPVGKDIEPTSVYKADAILCMYLWCVLPLFHDLALY